MKLDDESLTKILKKMEQLDDIELKQLLYLLLAEREHLNEKIRIDSLTGIYNRRIIKNIKDCNIVVMCDIDNFKLINENFGHIVGDEVIREVAIIIKNNIGINDLVCRYGGDEFLIAFFDYKLDDIIYKMEKIKSEITNSIYLPNCIVTISVGISESDSINNNIDTLVSEADQALYNSKRSGKDRVKVYSRKRNLDCY